MSLQHKLAAALFGLVLSVGITPSFAAPADYEFRPVTAVIKNGVGSAFAVRLINKKTGKPVEGAVLFRTRLDMSPDSMGEMTVRVMAMPSAEPGVYEFMGDVTMAGRWALKIQAKVPGETETVEGTVVFQAK